MTTDPFKSIGSTLRRAFIWKSCTEHGHYNAEQIYIGDQLMWTSPCPECDKIRRQDAEKRAAEEQAQQDTIKRSLGLKNSKIPLEYQTKTFDKFVTNTESQKRSYELAKQFVNGWEKAKNGGWGLIFMGTCGTGKTHLASSIALELLGRARLRYYTAAQLFSLVRSSYGNDSEKTEEEILNQLAQLDLLIIDEIGVQKGSDSELRILFGILDRRVSEGRPTILITNLNPQGLHKLLGERLYDRIRSKCVPCMFTGQSMRQAATADVFEGALCK